MDDPVEHRRLTLVALRIMGDVMACITVPVGLFSLAARRAGGGLYFIAAIGLAFIISTVTISLRAVKYNQWYLKGHGPEDSERGPPSGDATPGL